MVILTKRLRKFVLSEDKRGYLKDTRRKYWNELVKRAQFGIKHLILLGEQMPNRYIKNTFNASTLTPLFRTIFKVPDPENVTREDRIRLLEIAQALINIINYDLAPTLTRELYALLKDARIEKELIGIKALWLTRRGYDVKKS